MRSYNGTWFMNHGPSKEIMMSKGAGHDQQRRDQLAGIKQRLKEHGLRCTPARIAVLHALESSTSPLTHSDIAMMLNDMGVDKATVLRNLTDLANVGLARRTELGDRLWRYELNDPAKGEETHPHFLCIDCGSVRCLDDVELTSASRRHSSAVGTVTEILLKGHCLVCQGAANN